LRIRTHIFSWVFLATIVPLTALAISATYYIEYDYKSGVNESINTNINTISEEVKRHVQSHRNLALGLARSNAIREFLPVIKASETGNIGTMFNVHRSRINHYFEGFQTILQGMYTMRLMDKFGNSFIKVSHNRRSTPVYESISGVMFVEQEVDAYEFHAMLQKLPRDEVSMIVLPHNAQQSELMSTLSLLDYIVPLYVDDKLVGALSLTLFGEPIDRILNHSPRLYNATITVTENNPENPHRHGMVLYDDKHEIRFAQVRDEMNTVQKLYGEELLELVTHKPFGDAVYGKSNQNIYFAELFPYVSQLTSWIVVMQVDNEQINAPFNKIRLVIWAIAVIALGISLLLSDFGVRTIARPIRELSANLLSYAKGEASQRATTRTPIDEVRKLEQAFNTMADSLEQASKERDKAQHMMLQSAKLASIGQMAAGIGHELNNPLNNILSYAKLLERSADDKDPRLLSDLKSLKEEALRASDIVKGILNFARQVPPQYAPFEMGKWLQDTINLVRQTAKTAGIYIAYECDEELVIEGDRAQLQQALINLLINAVHASERDSEVKVLVTNDENEVSISVIDTGTGISEDTLDSIYDPFFTTKPEGEGHGLGLSVCLGIIERHNGTLQITNNTGSGVTAVMTIPLKQSVAPS
jgi:two-component system NtrC family sensor kinase